MYNVEWEGRSDDLDFYGCHYLCGCLYRLGNLDAGSLRSLSPREAESDYFSVSGGDEMSDWVIKVADNGPYRVEGVVKLVDADGNEFEHKEKFSLCRCGQSQNKPFCDGTHKTIDFQSAPRAK